MEPLSLKMTHLKGSGFGASLWSARRDVRPFGSKVATCGAVSGPVSRLRVVLT